MDKVLSERIWPAEFSFCLKILSPGESAMARPQRDQKNQVLDRTVLVRGSRGIICMCGEVMPIDQKNSFIPCNLI